MKDVANHIAPNNGKLPLTLISSLARAQYISFRKSQLLQTVEAVKLTESTLCADSGSSDEITQ